MKKLYIAISTLAMTLAAPAFAADQATTTSLKIGVVDVRQVLQKSPQMAAVNKALEAKYKPQQAKIAEAQKSLKAEEDKLARDSAVMSETERSALQQKIIADRANTQAMITTFQQSLNVSQNQDMQGLLSQIAAVVNQVAKDNKYDLILQGENVPYVDKRLNITDQIVQIMNKKG